MSSGGCDTTPPFHRRPGRSSTHVTQILLTSMDINPLAMRDAPDEVMASLAVEVLARCDEVAAFSEEAGRIARTFLCEPMRRLHLRLAGWMEAAGMSVRTDPAANLIGRYEGARGGA